MSWRNSSTVSILFLAGLSGLLGAVLGGLAVYFAAGALGYAPANNIPVSSQPAANQAPPQVMAVNTTDVQTTITQAVQQVGSAVVTVVGTLPGQTAGFGQSGEIAVSGSGVFITQDGYILTNNHVVEGMSEVSIVLFDGSQQTARVIGADPFADLAVLKTDGQPPAAARLGDSDVLDPGETVIAIGSPLGDFKNTVTVGVVSATGRSIDTGAGYLIEGLIQTDAAINQGNSGGPLLNLAGEVIGINTLVVRGGARDAMAEGLGFAVPANTARVVAEQIIQQGYFSRPYLGVRWQSITPELAALYNLPVQWGAYVTGVIPGSPAQDAGLQQGDIITRMGDTAMDENNTFINVLFRHLAGDVVTLEINRDGQLFRADVTLRESNTP